MKREFLSVSLLLSLTACSSWTGPTTPTTQPEATKTHPTVITIADPSPVPVAPAATDLDLSCKTRQRDVVAWVNEHGQAAFFNGIIILLPSSQKKVYLEPGFSADCGCRIVDVYPDVNWCQGPVFTPNPPR